MCAFVHCPFGNEHRCAFVAHPIHVASGFTALLNPARFCACLPSRGYVLELPDWFAVLVALQNGLPVLFDAAHGSDAGCDC